MSNEPDLDDQLDAAWKEDVMSGETILGFDAWKAKAKKPFRVEITRTQSTVTEVTVQAYFEDQAMDEALLIAHRQDFSGREPVTEYDVCCL